MNKEKAAILSLLSKLKEDIMITQKLVSYSIGESFDPCNPTKKLGWIKASTIRSKLLEVIGDTLPGSSDDDAVAAVLRIDDLALHGERYSNHCFDVLSNALSVLARKGIKP